MTGQIVVVGSINMDLVTTAQRMPAVGETLHGTGFRMVPGGKGANQAVAAARLGGRVSLIAQLGDDAFAVPLKKSVKEAGVETDWLGTSPGPSGCATILVDARGNNSIVVVAGANDALTPAVIDDAHDALAHAAILLTQLETPLETVLHLSRAARRLGIPLMLDPAPARELPSELLHNVSWLTPNETECEALLQDAGVSVGPLNAQNASSAAGAILELGVRNVALKLGAKGVLLAGQDLENEQLVPAVAVNAVDTTAAGDAFNGAFAFALTSGKPPVEAARFACAVAALSVTKHGAQTSMPTLAEVEQLVPCFSGHTS